MSSIRDLIAAANDIGDGEVVDVPEWGVKILVVSPTVEARSALLEQFPSTEGEGVDFKALFTSVLIATCHDPDTREPVFTDADSEMLLGKNGAVVQRLFEVCQKAAGLNAPEAIDSGKDGSS